MSRMIFNLNDNNDVERSHVFFFFFFRLRWMLGDGNVYSVWNVCEWIVSLSVGQNTVARKLMQMTYFLRLCVQLGWHCIFFSFFHHILIKMIMCFQKKTGSLCAVIGTNIFYWHFVQKHNIIRSINAWHYYNDVLFHRLFVWWTNFLFIFCKISHSPKSQ